MHRILSILITIAVALSGITVSAQSILPQLKREAPDMKKIAREVNDRTSEYYYPRLMREHLANDTTMKVEKYRRLYLGYMMQEDYNPYREHTVPDHVRALYDRSDKLTRQEADTVIKYAHRTLDDEPFDLYQMLFLIQAYRVKGKTNLAAIWNTKLKYILMAILSTGTGTSKEGAWTVMSPQHEYFLLQYLGYRPTDHQFLSPSYEVITAREPGSRSQRKFYFDIGDILETYYKKYN